MKFPTFDQAVRFLHSKNWLTWLGHVGWGIAIMALASDPGTGVYATSWTFGLREGLGIVNAGRRGQTEKLVDGMLDLMAPFVGNAIVVLVRSF